MIKEAISKVVAKNNLAESEMIEVMEEIMSGNATQAQIGSFITALRMKGETVDEITGASRVMRSKASKIPVDEAALDLDRDDINLDRETILDTCGTGGDGTMTFNISTATAFTAAGGGVKVAKHGNRSVSSLCGSADVLQEMGINIEATPEIVGKCIQKAGIGFLFAPSFHGAMKYAIGPRREIGIRTIFNILGPLTNPAGASYQILGVYQESLTEILASVLKNLGTKRAMVVHGMDGIDEITITGKTKVSELKDGKIETYFIKPEDFGLKSYPFDELKGGNAKENAEFILKIFRGELTGAKTDIVLLNSGAAFYITGMAASIQEGVELAKKVIESKKALEKVNLLKEVSRS